MESSVPSRPRVAAGLRLVALVGAGGEGEVWEARDRSGRRRALKLIRPGSLVAPDEVRRRGRWLVGVRHPALCRVTRTGLLRGAGLDGWGFVEMDFVDGEPADALEADPDALTRLGPLAEALDLLHAGRWSDGVPLVHRDIKPANLIDTDAGFVLVDHSTLRAVDGTTQTRIGTPVFVAPEVASGRAGPPADVYAFAVTAVALLTGARGAALAELVADPAALQVPEGVRRALSAAAGDRPTSCAALLDDRPLPAPSSEPAPPSEAAPLPAPSSEAASQAAPGAEAGPRRLRVWPWLLLLAGVASAVVAATAAGLPAWPQQTVAWALAAALHLGSQRAAGRPMLLAVAVPPVAWGLLLAARGTPAGPSRRFVEAAATGAAMVLGAALAAPVVGSAAGLPGLGAPAVAAELAAAGWALTAAAAGSARTRRWLRVVLSPLWLLGAGVLVAGATALLPAALLVGRGRALTRALGGWVAGVRLLARSTPRRAEGAPDVG